MLLKTCILSGCDYLESIRGIGFKKALKLVKDHSGDIEMIIKDIERNDFHICKTYLDDFNKAYLTFKHQPVYDCDLG